MDVHPSKSEAEGACNPTEAAKPAVLYVAVDPDLRRRFKTSCSARGLSMRERLTALMAVDCDTPASTPVS